MTSARARVKPVGMLTRPTDDMAPCNTKRLVTGIDAVGDLEEPPEAAGVHGVIRSPELISARKDQRRHQRISLLQFRFGKAYREDEEQIPRVGGS